MKNIIIDTCVLIHIIKKTITGDKCLKVISEFEEAPNIIISVVTKAEIESFVIQNSWGDKKIEQLQKLLNSLVVIDINQSDLLLLSEYSWIDSFSKRKIKDKSGHFLKGSARKMGKNDLWIAATASALGIPLMTCDGDFDHLAITFLNLIKIV